MTAYTKLTGTPYLTRLLRPFIFEIVNNGASFEVDPNKAREGENLEFNLARLVEMSQKLLDVIVRSVNEFPMPLRVLASHLMEEVGKKFPTHKHTSVGGFVFLRYLCPALLSPSVYGLIDNTSQDVSRPLVLVSKMLQNVSNGIEFGAKENFMSNANRFIMDNLDRVRNFFDAITTLPANMVCPSMVSVDETTHDLHVLHGIMVKNLSRLVKSLAQYKHKDIIPKLWLVLTDLGDPNTTAPPHK